MTDFGYDVSCVTDLDPAFRQVTGREAVAQAIARRLGTKNGALALIGDDPDYGSDLRELVGEDVGPRALFELQTRAEAEALKDERVLTAQASGSLAAGVLTLVLALSDADGPFRLVLAVSEVSVQILKVQ